MNENYKSANQNSEKIPYTQSPCENKGVLFKINRQETFVYIDFFENKIIVSLNPETSFAGQIYGYSHDYNVIGNDELIISIVDSVGGVELENENEKLRHTGLQVSELLKRTNSIDFKRELITAICKKIAKYGVNSAFIVNIINNSENDLNLAECYSWDKSLQNICANLHFID